MSNSGVNVFSEQVRFHGLGQIPSNAEDLQGWPIIKEFSFQRYFHVENLGQILVSKFSRNRRDFRTWNQFHRIEGTCKGDHS